MINNKIKQYMEQNNITAIELAYKCKCSERNIQNIIKNKPTHGCSLETAMRMAQILNIKVDELFYLN